MKRWLVGALLTALVTAAGCKGETVYKDSAETISRMETCENKVEQQANYIKQLEGQVTELKAKATGDELFVTMEGVLEIRSASGGSRKPPPDVDVTEQAKAFQNHVKLARGSVKRCYQNALKKDSSLTASIITVTVKVSYGKDGKVSRVGLSRPVSDVFSSCLKGVADDWKIPPAPKSLTFSQSFELTPQ
jgi:hypothetical protein